MEPRGPKIGGADHVIAGFTRDALSAALAATHRAGFGPQARVIDGARGEVAKQIERLGLRVPWEQPPVADVVLILVNAPGRTAVVEEIFSRSGAMFVVLTERPTLRQASMDTVVSLVPDVRIGDAGDRSLDA